MSALMSLARGIDRITSVIGRGAAWLVLVVVLVSAGNAVIRKIFDMSSNAWLEVQWYLFGAIFMLAAAWTLQRNEHIRVDIISNMLSKRTRDWIDFLGHLVMLLPFTILMVYMLVPYVLRSYTTGEGSPNAGGLIVWPAKALLLAGFILLVMQGVSELIKRAAILFFHYPDDTPAGSSHAAPDELAALAPEKPLGGADAPDPAHPAAPDRETRR
ncbi:TRAP transporter small permease subunit [Jiella marina]|uniref:TRAP transporter small permease subunit n=1 Tax=Jiella sp. LLJ827 TaxID=2917712 RepID=UPI0021012E3F|nr:TRAP transporter small permease subunit [Jiella sp. LLJ827]MCQ0990293.1 TRAP transporter small permease subunit [Jiella sp. LLJ827]